MRTELAQPSHPSSAIAGDLSRRTLLRSAAAGSLLSLGLGGLLRVTPASAQQGTPAASAPAPAHRLSLGQIEVAILNDATLNLPLAAFAVNAPPAAMAAEGMSLEDMISLSVQPLLVETGEQRVLLDSGIGILGPQPGNLLAALEAEGIAPEEIDIVVLSHLHTDHFGGMLDADGAPVFPNARVLLNGVERDFWAAEPSLDELVAPEELKAQTVQPAMNVLDALQDVIEPIAPGDEIAPGLTAVDARGHTPGHLALEIASGDDTLLYVADSAHVPAIQLAHPGWFMIADNWPAWAVATRTALFDRAADENLLVVASHFPFPGLGRVTKAEIGWDWTDEA